MNTRLKEIRERHDREVGRFGTDYDMAAQSIKDRGELLKMVEAKDEIISLHILQAKQYERKIAEYEDALGRYMWKALERKI